MQPRQQSGGSCRFDEVQRHAVVQRLILRCRVIEQPSGACCSSEGRSGLRGPRRLGHVVRREDAVVEVARVQQLVRAVVQSPFPVWQVVAEGADVVSAVWVENRRASLCAIEKNRSNETVRPSSEPAAWIGHRAALPR